MKLEPTLEKGNLGVRVHRMMIPTPHDDQYYEEVADDQPHADDHDQEGVESPVSRGHEQNHHMKGIIGVIARQEHSPSPALADNIPGIPASKLMEALGFARSTRKLSFNATLAIVLLLGFVVYLAYKLWSTVAP